MSKMKLADLQGIRGLAILAVLGFHFYPNRFPNGYLGVDQFFVLSGFLMSMLLTKSAKLPPSSLILTFYARRFKRILPLYLLFLASTLAALYLVFPEVSRRTNLEAAPRALLFVSNTPKSDEDDYFEMLEVAVNVFTHTWSLSVEVQFYFIIPVFYIIGNYLFPNYQILYYCVLGFISYAFNFQIPPSEAFNSMFARIWQFMIGVIVYLCQCRSRQEDSQGTVECEKAPLIFSIEDGTDQIETECKQASEKSMCEMVLDRLDLSSILVFLSCSIVMNPFLLNPEIFRPLTTILTGLLIYASTDNFFLTNEKLTYLGDISYSLYLIHWPCYAYWKLVLSTNDYALFDYLLLSIVLAIVVYEFFEKWYLTLPSINLTFFIVLLLTANLFLLWEEKKSLSLDGVFSRDTYDDHIVQEAIRHMNYSETNEINQEWNADDMLNLRYEKECPMPNGKLFGVCDTLNLRNSPSRRHRIFVFGNSWATNHYRLIHDECSWSAKAIRMAAMSGCEPLTVNSVPGHCKKLEDKNMFFNALKEFQPDYAFYFSRPISFGSPFEHNVTSLDDDQNYKPAEAELLKFLPYVKKKLFILDAVPNMNIKGFQELGNMLQNGWPLHKIDKYLLSDPEVYKMAKMRYSRLFEVCEEKCQKIDYAPEFWDSETKSYRFYDKFGLEYLTVGLHLSPHGLAKVRHVYKDICRKLE